MKKELVVYFLIAVIHMVVYRLIADAPVDLVGYIPWLMWPLTDIGLLLYGLGYIIFNFAF